MRFQLGFRPVQGVITEDRGPLGVGGRHLYRIEFRRESDPGSAEFAELPTELLELAADAAQSD